MNTKVLVVTSAKGNKERRRPSIKLGGLWLNEIGFKHNTLLSLECSEKNITIKLCDTASINHSQLSKKILKDDSKGIFHVSREWQRKLIIPIVALRGFWLEKFGFKIGGIFAVTYDFGIINIRLLDIEGISNTQLQKD